MAIHKVALTSIESFKTFSYDFGSTHPLRPLRLFLTYSLFEELNLLDSNVLQIIDNGIGIPVSCDINKTKSIGFQIILALIRQLNGNYELNRKCGTSFKIIFP